MSRSRSMMPVYTRNLPEALASFVISSWLFVCSEFRADNR